ncbi:MAG: hypothetical protein AAFV85_28035 [Cyanobacteria bacterium J06634_6]
MTKSLVTKSDQPRRWKKAVLIGASTLIPLLGVGAATASILPKEMGGNRQQWVLDKYSNPLEYLPQSYYWSSARSH